MKKEFLLIPSLLIIVLISACNQNEIEGENLISNIPDSLELEGSKLTSEYQNCTNFSDFNSFNCFKRIIIDEDRSNDEKTCLSIGKGSYIWRYKNYCLENFAIKKNDIKICNLIPLEEISHSSCINGVAFRTGNPEYCKEINYNLKLKDWCYSAYVSYRMIDELEVDSSPCEEIIDEKERNICKNLFN